jgi:hypothetical protein
MSKDYFEVPYFGKVLIEPARDYNVEIVYESLTIEVDLNFYEDKIDKQNMSITISVLNELGKYLDKNESILESDFQKSGAVKDYLEHMILTSDSSQDALQSKDNKKNKLDAQRMLSSLKLIRIGLYPDDDSHFVVYDYSIGTTEDDYRISIRNGKNGILNSIEFVT